MIDKTKSVVSNVLILFCLIQAGRGWLSLVNDWMEYVKRRGY